MLQEKLYITIKEVRKRVRLNVSVSLTNAKVLFTAADNNFRHWPVNIQSNTHSTHFLYFNAQNEDTWP